jgi:serine/threonine-protein kinase RsbW
LKITFTVDLPVDANSVPFARALCREALEHLAIEKDTIDEVVLALTEACANVVKHAGHGTDYEVRVGIDDDVCRISVFDDGEGFDLSSVAARRPDPVADGGHGLLLMRALVDDLHFGRDPDGRHCVTLEKRLR